MTDVFVVILHNSNMVMDEMEAVVEAGLKSMGWRNISYDIQRIDIE